MITVFGTDGLKAEWSSSTICIGVFDGVHLGHQRVISTAVEAAKQAGEPCVLLTFDRHPLRVLAPEKPIETLAPLSQNLAAFRNLGVTATVVVPFDESTASTEAQVFFDEVMIARLKAARVVVGHDFAFGKRRSGTTDWLSERIETTVVPPFEIQGHRVSSSEIRQSLAVGDVEKAHLLLGRPFLLHGVVSHGQRLGRTIGFPTANLALAGPQLLPKDGVYACWSIVRGERRFAAVSIGLRPAVQGTSRTIEAHLLDFEGGEFYGEEISLRFLGRVRDEEAFASLDHLADAIRGDVARVRSILNRMELMVRHDCWP